MDTLCLAAGLKNNDNGLAQNHRRCAAVPTAGHGAVGRGNNHDNRLRIDTGPMSKAEPCLSRSGQADPASCRRIWVCA
jgi:hypothetical protein